MKRVLKSIYFKVALALIGLLILNFIASKAHTRVDMTKDKRYTLSETTRRVLLHIKEPVLIEVLLKGDIPTEFKKLQTETLQLLEEYAAMNSNITVQFVNPLENESDPQALIQQMVLNGLNPLEISQTEAGNTSKVHIFPWAVISTVENVGGKQQERRVKVPLFVNKLGANDQEQVQNSVQRLEYNFTDAHYKLTLHKQKKIAILKSNGTLEDIYMADFIKMAREYYYIAPFTLDSVKTNAEKTLRDLQEYNLLVVPKPTEPFTDPEKQVLDQYVMGGGRVLWLIDNVNITLDDLYKAGGAAVAMPVNLNLTDMFFSYGFRINYTLVNDLYFSEIVIATGEGSQSRYMPIPWVYNPLVLSKNNHLITNHLDAVRLQFANGIDTLKNDVKKTVLLSSSNLAKADGTPREISLRINPDQMDKNAYKKGNIPMGVLLEGEFTSVYKDRVRPIDLKEKADKSLPTKMIVVSDGDIIKNDISGGQPLELGFDKWTSKYYDNKAFLQNAVNYLLDDTAFLQLRNKKVQLAFLDKEKVVESKKSWQVKVFVIPLAILIVTAIALLLGYRKKYRKKC